MNISKIKFTLKQNLQNVKYHAYSIYFAYSLLCNQKILFFQLFLPFCTKKYFKKLKFDAIKPEKLFQIVEIKRNSDAQTNLATFFSIWAAGFAMKDGKL